MFKNGAYYNGIGPWLKERFGMRISKVSIDGGFTCPNRDGTAGTGGCIFCSELGSGDFAGMRIKTGATDLSNPTPDFLNTTAVSSSLSSETPETQSASIMSCAPLRRAPPVAEQIDAQICALQNKWKDFRCIAYFQNFTNTYAPVSVLREKYEEALRHPRCIGLAVATRPDCLNDDVLDYLSELNRRTFLWIELGLQTSHPTTARYIRRGYPLSVYDEAVKKLTARGIRIVTHLIAGLPGESKDIFLNSVRHVVSENIFGIKLQLLHIMKHTDLAAQWQEQKRKTGESFPAAPIIRPLEKEEYISMIADALEIIPADVTIHRLTGDAPKETLLAPLWSRDKKSVLNGINMELKRRSSCQGGKILQPPGK